MRKTDSRTDHLQALVQAIPDAVLEVSPDGLVLDGTDRAATLFNWPLPDLVGRPLSDLFLEGASITALLQTAMRNQCPQSTRAQGLQRGHGPAPVPIPVDVSIGPWTSGTPPHASVIVRDISDHLDAERQHCQAQKSEALGHLAGRVSHDFNNLLTPILALSERVANDLPEGDRNRDRLARVVTAAKRAAALVQRVQIFDRDTTLACEVIELEDLLQDVAQELALALPPSVNLTTTVQETARILGDPSALRAVFLELASNALDAMAPNGGQLLLDLTASPDRLAMAASALALPHTRSWVRVRVEDTGHGMPAEILARIFNPFFTTKSREHAPTMNLFLAQDIVTRHQGRIVASSQPGQGAVFEVYLPLHKAPA